MRIASWASALLLATVLASHASDEVVLPSGGSVSYSLQNGKTRFNIRTPSGRHLTLSVPRDSTVDPASAPERIEVVAEVQGAALVIVDTYRSIPGGMSYCQAGEERFLRVISIAKRSPRETYRIKLESCRDNIELAAQGVIWDAETRTLTLSWLAGPNKEKKPEQRKIRLSPGGSVVVSGDLPAEPGASPFGKLHHRGG